MNKLMIMFKNTRKMLANNSPTIFTSMAVAGVIGTTVLAIKATPRAVEVLEEARENKWEDFEEELTGFEMLQETWKCYIPTALMGAATIGCIIGANSVHLRRNAALASVYSLTESTLKEYQEQVKKEFGEKRESKIRDEVTNERFKKSKYIEGDVISTGNGDTLCFDCWTGRFFRSDINSVKEAFNKVCRDMLDDGFISMNDIYHELGLLPTKIGGYVGWHIDDGFVEPRFSSQLTENGDPCLVIDYNVEPKYGVEA